MDDVSWRALYLNQPIEREGLLYAEDELRRYFELPDQDPDGVISICDTKDKGKDYAFMPVAYVYGQDYYIVDCVCDNSLPDVVEPRLENCLFKDNSMYKKKEDYGKMMDLLCSYTVAGKNKHDDVPDGMAMLAEYAQSFAGNKVEIF